MKKTVAWLAFGLMAACSTTVETNTSTLSASQDAVAQGVTGYRVVDASRVELFRGDVGVGVLEVSAAGETRSVAIVIDGNKVTVQTEQLAPSDKAAYPVGNSDGGAVLRDPALASFLADWNLVFVAPPVADPNALRPSGAPYATCNTVCPKKCNCVITGDDTYSVADFDVVCPAQECGGGASCQDSGHSTRTCYGSSCSIITSVRACNNACGGTGMVFGCYWN